MKIVNPLRDLPPKAPDFFQAIRISFGTSKARWEDVGWSAPAGIYDGGITFSSSFSFPTILAVFYQALCLISFLKFFTLWFKWKKPTKRTLNKMLGVLGFEVRTSPLQDFQKRLRALWIKWTMSKNLATKQEKKSTTDPQIFQRINVYIYILVSYIVL